MADELKNDGITNLEDEEVENAAGGWAGSDKYNEVEYWQAGIKWVHNLIGADEYYYLDEARYVCQEEAERIADEYYRTHRK